MYRFVAESKLARYGGLVFQSSTTSSVPAVAIQFTQEQARALAEVTPGDLRQWRKAVPYLAGKSGKAARFTFSDLVGLTIAGELVRSFGVHISHVGLGIDALFRALSEIRPGGLDGLIAVVTKNGALVFEADELSSQELGEPSLILPCAPLLSKIRAQVMPFAPGSDQTSLPFRPQVLRARR